MSDDSNPERVTDNGRQEPSARKGPKLLSPAGVHLATAYAAVDSGADCVYVGVGVEQLADRLRSDLGYRGGISCYGLYEIGKILEYCNSHNVELHIALNNLYTDRQRDEARRLLEQLAQIGIDTVIVADPAYMKWISQTYPEMKIHASVVAGCVNRLGAKYYEGLGATSITLENSLGREALAALREQTDLGLGVFVYGITCLCFHGVCQLSPYITGVSCVAPCNKKITIDTADGPKTGRFLRARDLDLLDDIPDFAEMGLDLLKIEGRMRSTRYVATATAAARHILDSWKEGRDTALPRKLRRKLRTLPFFGTSRGYFASGAPEKRSVAGEGGSLFNKVLEYGAVRNPKLTLYLMKRRLLGPAGESWSDSRATNAELRERYEQAARSKNRPDRQEIIVETSLLRPLYPKKADRISVGEKHCALRFLHNAPKLKEIVSRIREQGAVPCITTPNRIPEDLIDRVVDSVMAVADCVDAASCYDLGLAARLSGLLEVTLLANYFGPEGAEFLAGSVRASRLRSFSGSIARCLRQGFSRAPQEIHVFGQIPLVGGIYCHARGRDECPGCGPEGTRAVRRDGVGFDLVGNTVYSDKIASAHLVRDLIASLPFMGLVIDAHGQSVQRVEQVIDFYRGEAGWPDISDSILCNGMYLSDLDDRTSRPVPWHEYIPDLKERLLPDRPSRIQ